MLQSLEEVRELLVLVLLRVRSRTSATTHALVGLFLYSIRFPFDCFTLIVDFLFFSLIRKVLCILLLLSFFPIFLIDFV